MDRFIFILLLCTLHFNGVSQPCVADKYHSFVGVREATGKNDGPQIKEFLKAVKLGEGYAWCAAFVRYIFDLCGIPTTINAMALSAHRPGHLVYSKGKKLKEPKAGDVFTLYYAHLKRIGHTGFFDKEINSKVYRTVEGNTNAAGSREGDGVYIKYRSYNSTYSISRWFYE